MTHSPKRVPIPPHRLVEVRRVATESGWPRHCPDPACARGHCDGPLRRTTPRGPFPAPTCLAIAIRMGAELDLDGFHDDPPSTEGRSLLAIATALR